MTTDQAQTVAIVCLGLLWGLMRIREIKRDRRSRL